MDIKHGERYGIRAMKQERSKFNFDTYRKRYIEYHGLQHRVWTKPMKNYINTLMKVIYERVFVDRIKKFLELRGVYVEKLRNSYFERKLPFTLSRKYDSKRFDIFLLDEFFKKENEISSSTFDPNVLLKIKTKIQEIDKMSVLEYDCMVRGDLIYRDLRIVVFPFGYTSIGKHVGHFIGYMLEDILREIIEYCIKKFSKSVRFDMLEFILKRYGLESEITDDIVGSCFHEDPMSFKTRMEKVGEQEINYNCGKRKRKI